MLKKLGIILCVAVIAVMAWIGYQIWLVRPRVAEAQTYVSDGRWREARHLLRQALRWSPSHAEGNVLMAEALLRDDLLTAPGDRDAGLKVMDEALEHLSRVPDDSPFAAEAHFQIGRIEAVHKLHPAKGLDHLRRATQLDSSHQEAYFWIWKIHELLGRPHLVVDDVWKAIELAPPELRPVLLRDWYMGEFFALTANIALETQMGLLAPGTPPSSKTQADRYLVFVAQEPESTYGYVALARWFLNNGLPEDSLQRLDEALQNAEQPLEDPLLIATLVQVLDDLGKIDEAEKYFEQWPGEKDGYDYWKCKGLIEHRSRKDLDAAIEAYQRAMNYWPGQVDWRTWNLLAGCLREANRPDEAARVAERSNEIERLMRTDIQATLRANLGNLGDPQGLQDVARFYRDLELNREANAWQEIIDSLESKSVEETQD